MSTGDVAVKMVIYIAAGLAAVVFGALGWLGKRVLQNKEEAAADRDEKIKELTRQTRENTRALRQIQRQMGSDHQDVEDLVQRLDDKLETTHQLLKDLK